MRISARLFAISIPIASERPNARICRVERRHRGLPASGTWASPLDRPQEQAGGNCPRSPQHGHACVPAVLSVRGGRRRSNERQRDREEPDDEQVRVDPKERP